MTPDYETELFQSSTEILEELEEEVELSAIVNAMLKIMSVLGAHGPSNSMRDAIHVYINNMYYIYLDHVLKEKGLAPTAHEARSIAMAHSILEEGGDNVTEQ